MWRKFDLLIKDLVKHLCKYLYFAIALAFPVNLLSLLMSLSKICS